MATHSSILAWEIPWTKEPGELQSMGSQKLDMTEQLSVRMCTHECTHTHTCLQGCIQACGSRVRISVCCVLAYMVPPLFSKGQGCCCVIKLIEYTRESIRTTAACIEEERQVQWEGRHSRQRRSCLQMQGDQ